jgi:hypothetical protein
MQKLPTCLEYENTLHFHVGMKIVFEKQTIFLRNDRDCKPVEGLDVIEKLSYMYIYP